MIQDMNRLPRNLMPPLIEEGEEEDEGDVEEEDIENEVNIFITSLRLICIHFPSIITMRPPLS